MLLIIHLNDTEATNAKKNLKEQCFLLIIDIAKGFKFMV